MRVLCFESMLKHGRKAPQNPFCAVIAHKHTSARKFNLSCQEQIWFLFPSPSSKQPSGEMGCLLKSFSAMWEDILWKVARPPAELAFLAVDVKWMNGERECLTSSQMCFLCYKICRFDGESNINKDGRSSSAVTF